MANHLLTPEWLSTDMLRAIVGPMEVSAFYAIEPLAIAAVSPPALVIPPSVLIAGLAVAVAAKVPFSRRSLIMPWKVGA